MDELSPLRLWTMRAAFLVLTVVLLFFHLLPIETQPVAFLAPELTPPLVSAQTRLCTRPVTRHSVLAERLFVTTPARIMGAAGADRMREP